MNLQSLLPWAFVGQTFSSRFTKRLDNINAQKVCAGLGRDVPLLSPLEKLRVFGSMK